MVNPNSDDAGEIILIGDEDPFYKATKSAIKTLGVVSQFVSDGLVEEEVYREITDPLVRDTALSAVQGLSPSAKSHLNSVMLITRDSENKDFAVLTPSIRRSLKKYLQKPITGGEFGTFSGVVREIDLDLKRFALRRLVGTEIQEMRCVYTEKEVRNPEKLVNQKITVNGRVQHDQMGNPKLLQVHAVEEKEDRNESLF